MPLYEYKCENCGRKFEKIRKFSDPPLKVCENCGGELEQLLSSPAIQFKGTGWYVTDYARKSSGSDGDSARASSSSTDKKEKEPAKAPEPAKATPSKE